MSCSHRQGDYVGPYDHWLCGECFQWVESGRPVKYSAQPTGGEYWKPQEIIWQAHIVLSHEGTKLSQFIKAAYNRLKHKGGLDNETALAAAIDLARSVGAPFGNTGFDWSLESARELVDDDMQYWDELESDGSNQ